MSATIKNSCERRVEFADPTLAELAHPHLVDRLVWPSPLGTRFAQHQPGWSLLVRVPPSQTRCLGEQRLPQLLLGFRKHA